MAEGRAEPARAAKAEFTEIQAEVARRSGRAGGLRRHQRRAGTDARAVGRSGHSGRGGAGAHERADVALDEGAGMIRVLAGAAAAAAVWAWWPFAAPVADLIAMHSPIPSRRSAPGTTSRPPSPSWGWSPSPLPRTACGSRTPGRRPVAGAPSPWPLAAADPSPALVVGEVHHPVAEREGPHPGGS